jgi:predicted 3-demethylubiquinone-9 3-methyltransferase (glyoxalase superfamily)
MQKITPFLWFNDQAEEAMNFYVSIFKNSKVLSINRWGETGARETGPATTVTFELEGQEFVGLNGGPHYTFTPAISLFVNCDTQEEVDELWAKLSEGGGEVQCGWIWDKYGLSWQIIPSVLRDMLSDKDPEKSARVWAAMLKMVKIDIATLQQAYDGR